MCWISSGHVGQPNALLFEEATAWSHHSDSLHDICLSHLQLNTSVCSSVDCCRSNDPPHHKKALRHSRSATTSSAEFTGVSFCGMLALRLRDTNTTWVRSSVCTVAYDFFSIKPTKACCPPPSSSVGLKVAYPWKKCQHLELHRGYIYKIYKEKYRVTVQAYSPVKQLLVNVSPMIILSKSTSLGKDSRNVTRHN